MFVPRASVEMTTAASAVRTGTAVRPRPGSNAIRTPVTSEGRPPLRARAPAIAPGRSEEHTSELQSRRDLVCRLLLEKKKKKRKKTEQHRKTKKKQKNKKKKKEH